MIPEIFFFYQIALHAVILERKHAGTWVQGISFFIGGVLSRMCMCMCVCTIYYCAGLH